MGLTSRDKRDIYYRLAKSNGWRARSAYKLMQIQEHFNIFKDVSKVVDLCAAPGSWSQVITSELHTKHEDPSQVRIVAVDLQPMAPLPGVIQLKGDITEESTAEAIIGHFDGQKADLVVCDGAPDVTGLHAFDEFLQGQLVFAAFNISTFVLKEGGTFVSKVFLAGDGVLLKTQMSLFFKHVDFYKPQSSRISSSESFIVCREYQPPAGYTPNLKNILHSPDYERAKEDLKDINKAVVPFMCCGDLSGFDSERSFDLDTKGLLDQLRDKLGSVELKEGLRAVAPPTEPAYKEALEKKKTGLLDRPV
ncbi:unnamed protein product [Bursaphelenchus xylophilus]|uniref:Putative tRNA (cytidine(32)/guanosine(34)-2'-O)-methyltransferase n=1 Tax=Bursaphelenchus xylophilus TaxID=6326 RepID=A0A1I7RI87_BURXY|nr:unnamed protein product [Bursaphelenchus xylophilus]CAG9115079.1 unnamed protein product [Bursaphelenchus xylophilus]